MTKENIIKIINLELSTLECSNICVVIEDYANDFIAKNFAMGLFATADPTDFEIKMTRNSLNGVAIAAETSPHNRQDTVYYYVGALQYTYTNNYSQIIAINDGNEVSFKEYVRQMVRHEWRHCQQFSKIREAGYGFSIDLAGTAEMVVGYGQGPLEKDAWSFQKGDDDEQQSWEDFVASYKENWEAFLKLIQEQGYTLEKLRAEKDAYLKAQEI